MTQNPKFSEKAFREKYYVHRLVAAIIIKNDKKQICLIKEKRIRNGREIIQWSVPGGLIEVNERIIDGAVREVKEETNFTVEIEQLLGIIDWSKASSNELGQHSGHFGVDFIFGANYVKGQAIPQTKEGILDVAFFDYQDISRLKPKPAYLKAIKRYLDNKGIPLQQVDRNVGDFSYLAEFV